MRRLLSCIAALAISSPAAAGLDDITDAEALRGLRQALTDGSLAAVARLGVENGFFGNPKVKIPLPPSLQRVGRGLRAFGMRREFSPGATPPPPTISGAPPGRSSPSVFSRSSRERPTASAWRNSTTRWPSRARRWVW